MQFIPRLSSTSINNKHLHKTRARLRGRRRHRPARSASDETLCLLGPCSAPYFPFIRLVLSPQTTGTINSSPRALIKATILPTLTRLGPYSGGRVHLWLVTRDRRCRPPLLCPLSLHQLALPSCD